METIFYKGWQIEETPCFPCSFKISKVGFASDNHTWRYHDSIEKAEKMIDRYEKS